MSQPVTIYALVDEAGQVHYIGQTRHTAMRRRQHCALRPHLTMIVVTMTDEAHANDVERYWIGHYRGQGCQLLNAKGYRPGGRGSRDQQPGASATTTVGFWLSRDERSRLEYIARQENRSVHGQVRQFIDEALAARAQAAAARQADPDHGEEVVRGVR